jgi:ATP-dependent DNA helicase RecG
MRPELLNPLFAPVTSLKGVGPRIGKLIEKLAGDKIVDLCWHLPSGLTDRRFRPKVVEAPDNVIATMTVTVDEHRPSPNRRIPYRVICSDETGSLTLVFFNAREDYLRELLPEGSERIVSGRVAIYQDAPQIAHPDYVLALEKADEMPLVEPQYPLTAGLTSKPLLKSIKGALDRVPEMPEWQEPNWLKQQGWDTFNSCLTALHHPTAVSDLEPEVPERQRLAYDELLANQLALALIRAQQRKVKGRVTKGNGEIRQKILQTLPFALTGAQTRVIQEIDADMADDGRMLRLLQGDVGSGKTAVALLTMATALEAGRQAAMMAPTEILARQHAETLAPLCEPCGINLEIITGRDKGKSRQEKLNRLASGEINIVVGTHALFQDDIQFKDLGLAVIDEQHRFGVHQRLTLAEKGANTDVLVMTATPIPRTLAMTVYGDMEVSKLDEKPPGRLPVDTRALPIGRLDDVITGVGRAIAKDDRVYWVCPLVEESDVLDLAAAEDRYAELAIRFGDQVGLVHGRMKGPEKDQAMADFASGKIKILVATTVIEVGVNVAEACIMVVEHAERFGLSQLHQLRGRVGRSDRQGSCLLVYAEPLGEAARARIAIMRETDDGFRIAEEDLQLRGAGEVLGTQQSGFPTFRIADLTVHSDLMLAARDDAQLILSRDRHLESPRGQALRTLLYLFERDAAVKYLRSG